MAEHKIDPASDNETLSIQRGDYRPSPLPTTLFVLGRLLTIPLQPLLLRRHPLTAYLPAKLFPTLSPIPTGGALSLPFLGSTLGPRLHALITLMPTVLSLKHVYWALVLRKERFTLPFALVGVAMDLVYESTTTLVFSASGINPGWREWNVYVGSAIYFTGVAIELIAELQRARFKAKPENKGKLCTTGLWGVTRHVNYSANVLFGFGYGFAAGGWVYACMTTGMYLSNFLGNAIPSCEAYCKRKYKGGEWERYVSKVKWMLIPGIV